MTVEWYLINLIQIVISILIGILSGVFTRFFSFLIGNPANGEVTNNVLSFYGRFILKKYQELELNRPSDYTGLNFWKAAGVCPYCINVYITTLVVTLSHYTLGVQWWWLPLILGVSHIALGKLYDWE